MTQSSPRFSEVGLTTGVRVRYAEMGSPSAPAVMLLHGFTDSWFSYSSVLPGLAETHHVFALDQRGHGNSDRPETGYAIADFAADVAAFLDAKTLDRVTVVGHSMGSFIAMETALAIPDRIANVVLIGSAVTPRNAGTLELQHAVSALTDPVPEEFAREFQAGTVYRPLADEFMRTVVSESLKLPARVWRAALDGLMAYAVADRLGEIRPPVLVLGGDRDAVFPLEEQERLAELLPAARLTVYPETGHSPHWEHPERFVRDCLKFVSAG